MKRGPGTPCTECGEPLPADAYRLRRAHEACAADRRNRFQKERMNALRDSPKQQAMNYRRHLQKRYGVSYDEALRLMALPGCEACGKPRAAGDWKSFSVDHHHGNGIVRGLLCRDCNLALGFAHDDIVTLKNLIAYLER